MVVRYVKREGHIMAVFWSAVCTVCFRAEELKLALALLYIIVELAIVRNKRVPAL